MQADREAEESKAEEPKASNGDSAQESKAEEPKASNGDSATWDADDWGKFYSMPPKWTKNSSHSKSGLTDENIGHKLASLLRYHLDDTKGLTTDEEGWVDVAEIVAIADDCGLEGCTVEDLMRVAESNEHSTRGRRFDSNGESRIRATYRHPPKDRRNDRYDRDAWKGRESRSGRDRPSRRGGYNDNWQGNTWTDDAGKWKEGGAGEDSWTAWKKPGFSPLPDDKIVKESTWAATVEKPAQEEPAVEVSQAACDWEAWFTPDTPSVMYFYNTKTEEVFYPSDVADAESKGWFRYMDTEGEKEGKIYWWHESTDASFYEEDATGDLEAEAQA